MTTTFTAYLQQNTNNLIQVLPLTWVQVRNNITANTYVSTAATDGSGQYTIINAPDGNYTVYIGPTVSGPWTVTGNTNLVVVSNPMTTKGDLIGEDANSTPTRLGVGANGTVLTADSTQTLGIKWATAAGSSALVKIYDSNPLGGTATNIDSGAGGFATDGEELLVVLTLAGDTSADVTMIFNNDSGANYDWIDKESWNSGNDQAQGNADTKIKIAQAGTIAVSTTKAAAIKVTIPSYGSTTFHKAVTWISGGFNTGLNNVIYGTGGALWANTAAIARVKIAMGSGNFQIGSRMVIYKVKG